MNAILYYTNKNKKINGTLFYCFEYFVYLKQYLPDLKYILMNTDENDMELFKSVFTDKYDFDVSILDNIIPLPKYTDFMRLDVRNLMTLDVHSYTKLRPFMGKVKSVRAYSNDKHKHLDKKPNHVFYGWYEYQNFNIKERLKLYRDIHKVHDVKGDRVFVSTPAIDNYMVVDELGLNREDVYLKLGNEHHYDLFKHIGEIVYYHSGYDKNNRIVVESYIHNIPITICYNGHDDDSVKERYEVLTKGNPDDLFLDDTDVMTKDFIDDCKNC